MTEREVNEQIVIRLDISNKVKHSHIMGHCPYHTDRHPSCSIDMERSLWHCFSCGRGGTLRSLFKDITGHTINKELGIKWESKNKQDFINPFKEKDELDLSVPPEVHIALDGAFSQIEKIPDCCKYLMNRKIPIPVAHRMGMKYADMARSFDINDPNNKDKYVYFTKRLLIPIYEKGKLMSCEGRDIFGKDYYFNQLKRNRKDPAQYEYKKCIYPKGASTSTLFGIDRLDKAKTLYFVEGIMDLAILRTDSYFNEKNSTAIFGASISERQLYLLKQFDFVYIHDNDLAGYLSLKRLCAYLKQQPVKKNWKFLTPPYHELGVKDAGDIPVKTNKTIEECRKAHWLDNVLDIIPNEKYIDEKIAILQKEKKECEKTSV